MTQKKESTKKATTKKADSKAKQTAKQKALEAKQKEAEQKALEAKEAEQKIEAEQNNTEHNAEQIIDKKYKKNDIHKVVYSVLELFDCFAKETEQTARNTHCDKATLACNRADCTIIVREQNSCVRRFVEIWGLSNNDVRLFQNKKDYELLASKSKSIAEYFEKYKDEKLSKKYNKFVIKCNYIVAVNCIQLMIDTAMQLDAEKEAK